MTRRNVIHNSCLYSNSNEKLPQLIVNICRDLNCREKKRRGVWNFCSFWNIFPQWVILIWCAFEGPCALGARNAIFEHRVNKYRLVRCYRILKGFVIIINFAYCMWVEIFSSVEIVKRKKSKNQPLRHCNISRQSSLLELLYLWLLFRTSISIYYHFCVRVSLDPLHMLTFLNKKTALGLAIFLCITYFIHFHLS